VRGVVADNIGIARSTDWGSIAFQEVEPAFSHARYIKSGI
jgi:hypothetical protein